MAAVVRRAAPDEVQPATRRGAPAGRRSFRLAHLLACGTCGTLLTGSLDRRYDQVRYYCHRGRITEHSRGWVSESKVIGAIRDEAERAALMIRRLQKGSRDDEANLAALAAKRSRVIDTYADGLIDKAERDRRLAAVAESESKLSTRRWVRQITLPPDVERDDPAKVNAYLRRLFDRVTVDMSGRARRGPSSWVPILTFEWRDPSMRGEALPDGDISVGLDGTVVLVAEVDSIDAEAI